MDQIVIAVIGVAGLLVPAVLSTRFGKWRILHLIQEEGKAHDAVPEHLTEERATMAAALRETVARYKDRQSPDGSAGDTAMRLAIISWLAFVLGSLGLNIGSDSPDPLVHWLANLRLTLVIISIALLVIGSIGALLLVVGQVLWVLARTRGTRPFAVWLLRISSFGRLVRRLADARDDESEVVADRAGDANRSEDADEIDAAQDHEEHPRAQVD